MSLSKYWTEERLSKIREALSKGAPIGTAARFAGVPVKIVKTWFMRGESVEPDSKDPDDLALNLFWQECAMVMSTVQLDAIRILRMGSKVVDWRSAESWLSRVDPDQWSTKQHVEISGEMAVADVKSAQRAIAEEFGAIGRSDTEPKES